VHPRLNIRFAALVVVVGCALTTVACGSEDESGSAGASQNGDRPAAGKSLTYVAQVQANPISFAVACGVRKRAEELGATVDVQAPDVFEAAAQTRVINGVVASKPDALLVSPDDAKALYTPLRRAGETGITVATVMTKIDQQEAAPLLAEADYVKVGKLQAQALAELLKDKPGAKVALLRFAPGQSSAPDAMAQGFEDELKQHPNLVYVGPEVVDIEPGSSTSKLNALLAREPDLQGIVSAFPDSTAGAVTALRQRDRGDDVVHVAAGMTEPMLEPFKSGLIDATIGIDFPTMGAQAAERIIKRMDGEQTGEVYAAPLTIVTPENFDDPAAKRTFTLGECPK
jgi:ribose transport system substrate-binding protein